MNTAKIYEDSEGNEIGIYHMVRREPDWAANRVQEGEKAIEILSELKAWDIENFRERGNFSIPLQIRERIQKLVI